MGDYSLHYFWVYQILLLLKYYTDGRNPVLHPYHEKGFREISRTLEKTYVRLEHTYYKYMLRPSLDFYVANDK